MHTYMFNNTVLAALETVILGKNVNQCSVTIMFVTIHLSTGQVEYSWVSGIWTSGRALRHNQMGDELSELI